MHDITEEGLLKLSKEAYEKLPADLRDLLDYTSFNIGFMRGMESAIVLLETILKKGV